MPGQIETEGGLACMICKNVPHNTALPPNAHPKFPPAGRASSAAAAEPPSPRGRSCRSSAYSGSATEKASGILVRGQQERSPDGTKSRPNAKKHGIAHGLQIETILVTPILGLAVRLHTRHNTCCALVWFSRNASCN